MKSEYGGKDRRIDRFFNLSIDLLCIASIEGYFVDVNPSFTKTLGYSRAELTSKPFLKFVHPDDHAATVQEIQKLSQGKQTLYFENRYRCKDGSYIWLGWRCPAPDPDTGLMYAVARDLTKYKNSQLEVQQSQLELQHQKQSLEQKNIALQEVLAQIEIEKNQLKDEILTNVEELILPQLQKLKRKSSSVGTKHIDLLEHNLKSLCSSFGRKVSSRNLSLTPKEIEICNMIKSGFSSKDIAQMLNLSLRTVDNHRAHIRTKFGLSGKSVNLVTYLNSI